jgi:L-ribulose-5-phosphate 3-epimerase
MSDPSRRIFLKQSLLTGSMLPWVYGELVSPDRQRKSESPLQVHIFSKHLQFLNYREMAEAAAEMGFDGVDLSVRPNGHVLPKDVEKNLPKAVNEICKVGFKPLIMTTAVDDASDPTDLRVLKTASNLGFRFYRMNYFQYAEDLSIPQSINVFNEKVKALGALNKELGLMGLYQNHAGLLVGSNVWDMWELLKDTDSRYMGIQYDIRHAVVEGGLSWPNGLRLLQKQIGLLAIKDCKWVEKKGLWSVEDTPLGEGMVDFNSYFKILKHYGMNPPISLHFEHIEGGVKEGAAKITVDKEQVFRLMKKDLLRLRELWQQA